MPRIPTDYSKTIIYKLVCKDLIITDLYVGHTTNFIERKWCHKSRSKYDNSLIYKTINDNGGWDNWEMVEIEKYPCKDGNEARTRERFWYEEINAKLNSIKPITSLEEKNILLKNYKKEYYETNKEVIKEQHKEYREQHKDTNKEYQKQYREQNKEAIKEYMKQYRLKKKLS